MIFQHQYLIIDCGSHSIKGVLYETGLLRSRIIKQETLPLSSLLSRTETEEASRNEAMGPIGATAKEVETAKAPNLEDSRYEAQVSYFIEEYFPDKKSYSLILAVSQDSLYARDLSLPSVKKEGLSQLIAFEAEETLPYTLEDMDIVGHSWPHSGENLNVLAFAAKKEYLFARLLPFSQKGIVVDGLVPGATLLAELGKRIALQNKDQAIEVFAQIDIGASQSILNIICEGKLAFSRTLSIGGKRITQLIAEYKKLSFEEAERLKLGLNLNLGEETEEEYGIFEQYTTDNELEATTEKEYNHIRAKVVELFFRTMFRNTKVYRCKQCASPSGFLCKRRRFSFFRITYFS